MKISEVFERRRISSATSLDQQYCTSLKWGYADGRVASGYGNTQQEADAACLEKIRARFQGTYTPLWLSFRSETILVWRDGNRWIYGHIRERNEPTSLVIGNWESRAEAERDARRQLAKATWDGQEESSEILTSPDEQRHFQDWTRTQKLHSATLQQLREVGWTQQEALHLLNGVGPNAERAQELGDPWPLIRAMEREWKENL